MAEGEIVRAEPGMLEAITDSLGSNLAIEKAAVQDKVVSDSTYEAGMKASELLLQISGELTGALNRQPFSMKLDVPDSKSSVLSVNKKGRIFIETLYRSSADLDSRIKVYPNEGKILIKIRNDYSNLKRTSLGGVSFAISVPLGFIIGPPSVAIGAGLFVPSLVGLLEEDNFWTTQHVYRHDKFFRNIHKFAYRHTQEKTDKFVDYYLSLPGVVYNAVGSWITRNESTLKDVDRRQAEFKLLEEKLR